MPTHDRAEHPLLQALRTAFGSLEDAGEVDLVEVPGAGGEFEVQADDWTLSVQGWPVTSAFIALDDEPATVEERGAALDAALDTLHLAALRLANGMLDNAIVAALERSGDDLSALLAEFLEATSEGDDPEASIEP